MQQEKIVQLPHGYNKGGEHNESPAVTSSAFPDNNFLKLPPELQGKKFRIRKLSERECFRLMDVEDADIDKIQATGISRSAQYKLAGNSIVVACLYHIFDKLFIDTDQPKETGTQLTLF